MLATQKNDRAARELWSLADNEEKGRTRDVVAQIIAWVTVSDSRRKVLITYVELKGYKNGEIGGGHQRVKNGLSAMTLDEIAKELNISKRNLQRVLRIERSLTAATKLRIIFNCPILRQMGIIFPKCSRSHRNKSSSKSFRQYQSS